MFRYVQSGTETAYAVVGGRFAVLAGGDADDAAQLWDAVVAEDAELEDVLTVLARHGVRRAPDFAVVEVLDPATGSMLVVVRGRGRVGIGAAWISAAPELQTWFETAAEDVRAATLTMAPVPAEPAEAGGLPLASGVVAASALRWMLMPDLPSTPGGTTVLGLSDEDTILGSVHRRTPLPEADGDEPAQEPEPEGGASAAGSDAAPEGIEEAGEPAPLAADTEEEPATIFGARRSTPAPAGYALVFDDGRVLRLGIEPVIVGRLRRASGPRGERWETLPSPAKEISGTHAELRLTSGVLLVTDLSSTNGTVVAARDDEPFVLRDGASAHLALGDRLDFGEGNGAVFQTEPPR